MISYNKDTGKFTRTFKNGVVRSVGHITKKGYVRFKFEGKMVLAHRIAFLFMGENIPELVDHINGQRSDNRWCNLRPATHSDNSCNAKSAGNSTGVRGVSKNGNKFYAEVRRNNIRYIKSFIVLSDAATWVKDKRYQLHKEFTYHEQSQYQ